MTTAFLSSAFQNNAFQIDAVVVATVKTGTGGIDPQKRRRQKVHLPFKPTGLIARPTKEGRKDVQDRVDDSRQIQADIAENLAKEFSEETESLGELKPIAAMQLAEIESEIGLLLRAKIRREDDEMLLLLMMVAAAT